MTTAAGVADIDTIAVGEQLPPYAVQLTLQRLVMEAAANRDFAPIHYDTVAARDSGAPDVYVNTTFIETLFEALLRTWAGLSAKIRVIEFSMKAFNCVGDEIAAHGEVTAVRDEGAERVVEVGTWVEGPRGRTVVGSAVVAFPRA
jgi:acyl dehydratase